MPTDVSATTRMCTRASNLMRRARYYVMRRLDLSESDETVQRDADRYWNGAAGANLNELAHWRGAGIWENEQRWLAIGETHLALAESLSRAAPAPLSLDRVIEWGSGGGANAAVFSQRCRRFYGVDIAEANLAECERVLHSRGFSGFRPVKIDVAEPEAVLSFVDEACDLFLCTYVFELIPSKRYGEQLLRLAHRLVRRGCRADPDPLRRRNPANRSQASRLFEKRDLLHLVCHP